MIKSTKKLHSFKNVRRRHPVHPKSRSFLCMDRSPPGHLRLSSPVLCKVPYRSIKTQANPEAHLPKS